MSDKQALSEVRKTTLRRAKSEEAWRRAIRNAHGYGCSLREIAGAADISHVRVLQIVRSE